MNFIELSTSLIAAKYLLVSEKLSTYLFTFGEKKTIGLNFGFNN